MSVQKGHFGENWAVKVKTGLKRTLGGNEVLYAFGENECAKGTTGVKTGLFWKINVLKGH